MRDALRRMRPVACAAVAAMLAPLPGVARPVGADAVMEAWGIMGTWAADCSAPPGRNNTFYTYLRRDGGVFLDRDGSGFRDSSPITRAAIRPDGMIEYHVDFGRGAAPDIFINTFAKRADGRIRIFFNRSAAGEVTVRDGRLVPQGTETSWRERCPPGRSVRGNVSFTQASLMP